MKACVLESIGKLVYKDVICQLPAADEIQLKIKACGICSSDYARIFEKGTYHFPTIPGHEFCGQIVAVGENVSSNYIGKNAVVFPLIPCRKCESCLNGQYAQCYNYNYFGSRCDGAFAEYINVPVWNVNIFSKDLPYTVAALCEPTTVACHAVKLANIKESDNICIIGTGTIAILCGLWCKNLGANITFVSRNKRKKDFLQALGFDNIYINCENNTNILKDKLFNVSLECVGTSQAIENAITVLKPHGRCILVGNPDKDIIIPQNVYWKILRYELSLFGSWNSCYLEKDNDWKQSLKFLQNYKDLIQKLITHTFSLRECNKAFEILLDKSVFSIKGMFINEN